MNIFEIITLKFPGIQGVSYWHTQYDGTPWEDAYDGLVWENREIPKPTKEDLEEWAKDVDLQYRQQQAVSARVYPSIGDQLDMLYKDSLDGGTRFRDAIAAVKAAHPKPVE